MDRLVSGCPLAIAESVALTPPDESTYTVFQLLLLGPNLMSVLHQVVPGAMASGTIPDMAIPEPSISSPLLVLPFGPASHAAQSLEGIGLECDHRMVSRDTWVAHCTSWFTVLTLDSTGEPLTTTSTPLYSSAGSGPRYISMSTVCWKTWREFSCTMIGS